MKVSILIPCYNAQRWIGESIESALAQGYADKEVIVVDDGSTDQSRALISDFGTRIRTEFTGNRGGNAARNRLLEMSEGEWLQYLDADDYLLPDKISAQMAEVHRDPEVDILFGPACMRTEQNGDATMAIIEIPEPRDPWTLLGSWSLPQTGAPLWRKTALQDVGGWNEQQRICQEHELYLRLLQAGMRFRFNEASGAVYRHWTEGSVCRRDKRSTYRERVRIVNLAEEHLCRTGALTTDRLNAINQTRFICARILWGTDRKWAREAIRLIIASAPDFSPPDSGAPATYRFLFRHFGFDSAEVAAATMRAVRRR